MEFRKQQWKYHLLLFVIILTMDIFGDYVYEGMDGFNRNFSFPYILNWTVFYIAFYAVYFVNYFILSPRTLSKKRVFQFAVGVLLLIFAYAGIRYFLEEIVVFNITGIHNYAEASRRFGYYVFDNSYYAIKAILYSTALFLFFEYVENKTKMHSLQLEHKKAELSLLKTQLEPHFLFNTLNTFYTELVDTQPDTAKDVHKLSQLLRYVTYETHQDFMPLNKELQFIEDYIYFQKKRFEDNLFLDYHIEGIVGDQPIPSLVLIHFIENIFKHGILNDKKIPAKIAIRITNDHIEISTRNKISVSEKYSKKGIGEENLRKRLTAIYGTDYQLNFDSSEALFEAYLKMPKKNTIHG